MLGTGLLRSLRMNHALVHALHNKDLPTAAVCTLGVALDRAFGGLVLMVAFYLLMALARRLAARRGSVFAVDEPSRHIKVTLRCASLRLILRVWTVPPVRRLPSAAQAPVVGHPA